MEPTVLTNRWDSWAEEQLAALNREGLRRSMRGQPFGAGIPSFASNDYLALSRHPAVVEGAREAATQYGASAAASRLVSGHLPIHEQLECELADFFGTEAALVFGCGFLTNLGVLTSLAGPNDEIFADKLIHASLIDGMRMSGAAFRRYRHLDAEHLEGLLKRQPPKGLRLIVTDTVFSMDGDCAPLGELSQLAEEYGALLIADEAHAHGVFHDGYGLCARLTGAKPPVITGALGKAFGSYGGFVLCSRAIQHLLLNRARSFIYSTGMAPASAGAAKAALSIIREENRGELLLKRARLFHQLLSEQGVRTAPFESQIIPIMVGENAVAVSLAGRLQEKGVYTIAIRPPTVPKGTARLRLSVTLHHSEEHLMDAAKIISEEVKKLQ